MNLFDFREYIHTECDRLDKPVLNVKAIDLDKLKLKIDCSNLKSCDYLKKHNQTLYLIEISDFHYELSDYLEAGMEEREANKRVKEGVSLKISHSLLTFIEMQKRFNINDIEMKKVLLGFCKTSISDVVAFDFLSRNLENHYKPTFCSSIKIIPYTELENIFK